MGNTVHTEHFLYNHWGPFQPTPRRWHVRSSNLVFNLAIIRPTPSSYRTQRLLSRLPDSGYQSFEKNTLSSWLMKPMSHKFFPTWRIRAVRTRWPGQLAWLSHELFVYREACEKCMQVRLRVQLLCINSILKMLTKNVQIADFISYLEPGDSETVGCHFVHWQRCVVLMWRHSFIGSGPAGPFRTNYLQYLSCIFRPFTLCNNIDNWF